MRLAYFGMPGAFSARPLQALIDAGHEVVLVIRPEGGLKGRSKPTLVRDDAMGRRVQRGLQSRLRRSLLGHLQNPELVENDPFDVARTHGLLRYWVGDASSEAVVGLLRRERIDAGVVAFFNQLFRRPLLDVFEAGVVNAHPSLLPRHRGPSPIFWTYREGDASSGVSVHRVAPGEDDGPVLRRSSIDLPLGLPGEELSRALAEAAVQDVLGAVDDLEAGVPGTPQSDEGITRAPRPRDGDRLLRTSWPARRIYHFVRGVGRWHRLYAQVGENAVRVLDAGGWDEDRRPPGEAMLVGDVLLLACNPGMVELRVVPLAPGV